VLVALMILGKLCPNCSRMEQLRWTDCPFKRLWMISARLNRRENAGLVYFVSLSVPPTVIFNLMPGPCVRHSLSGLRTADLAQVTQGPTPP